MKKILFISIFIYTFFTVIGSSDDATDTIYIAHQKYLAFNIPQKRQHHQKLVMKIGMSQAFNNGKLKRRDNGESKVFLNYDQALEVIKKIDNLTLGIPKIIYVVGWQYSWYDTKYPVKGVKMRSISMEGTTGLAIKKIKSGKLDLTLGTDEMLLIEAM